MRRASSTIIPPQASLTTGRHLSFRSTSSGRRRSHRSKSTCRSNSCSSSSSSSSSGDESGSGSGSEASGDEGGEKAEAGEDGAKGKAGSSSGSGSSAANSDVEVGEAQSKPGTKQGKDEAGAGGGGEAKDEAKAKGKTAAGAEAGTEAKAKTEPSAGEKLNADSEAKAEAKGKGKKKSAEAAPPPGFLEKIRPRKRVIFFAAFLGACSWIVTVHDPCDVPKGSRQDCGYPDIKPLTCRALGCMMKGGGSATSKKVVKVERKAKQQLGLEVDPDTVQGWVTVTSIGDGAVQEHNAALPEDSEERIRSGDRIAKVDGTTGKGEKNEEAGHKRMLKALAGTGAKTVQVEVQRPKLPSFLMWIRAKNGKATMLEKVLTSPGLKQFSRTFSYLGGAGLACWLLSGYPMASLPLYYGGLSAFVSFYSLRCCHDSNVAGGTPHCYKPNVKSLEDVVDKVKKGSMLVPGKLRAAFKTLTS
mmetsp:Transcript_72175/g.218318  ORF Transcript_72175/g.218318 Transcript_72175/m.218318 type:complete len:472 (-) Transcript_72175:109-1524(-)